MRSAHTHLVHGGTARLRSVDPSPFALPLAYRPVVGALRLDGSKAFSDLIGERSIRARLAGARTKIPFDSTTIGGCARTPRVTR